MSMKCRERPDEPGIHRARTAGLPELALEEHDDARAQRPHVQVGLRRAIRQLRPDSRQRLAQRHVHRHTLRKSRWPTSCSAPSTQVSHGFGAADSFPILWKHQFFIQDEWKLTPRITMNVGSALRAVVPVGAGIRPLHVMGVRHAVDREARCPARHSVPRRSERAVQDRRERS